MKAPELLFAAVVCVVGYFVLTAPPASKPTRPVVPPPPPLVKPEPPKPPQVKVWIVTQAGCRACEILEAELKAGPLPFDYELVDWRTDSMNSNATPTIVKKVNGVETKRRVGSAGLQDLIEWVNAE